MKATIKIELRKDYAAEEENKPKLLFLDNAILERIAVRPMTICKIQQRKQIPAFKPTPVT